MLCRVRDRGGFTLVELMIVIAIIGVLASIAIPFFLQFRLRAKAAEARIHLGAIRTAEVAYYSEWNYFVADQPLTPVSTRTGDNRMIPWNYNTRFSILGFAPERNVYYSYSLEAGTAGLPFVSRAGGLSISAVGDLDADGAVVTFTVSTSSGEIVMNGGPF